MSFNSYAMALWPTNALQSPALSSSPALNPTQALALNPSNALALALQSSPALALALQSSQALALALQSSPALALALQASPALALQGSPALALQGSPALALQGSPALALQGSPALALALQSSPALALALQSSPALALALQSSPALAQALQSGPALAQALQASTALAVQSSQALAKQSGPASAQGATSAAQDGGGTATGYFSGFQSVPRSGYATAADLAPLPWSLNFNEDNFWTPFPTAYKVDPATKLRWRDSDWDPGLRSWALPFKTAISAWLQSVNEGAPATMMVRELSDQYDKWRPLAPKETGTAATVPRKPCRWISATDLEWHLGDDASRRAYTERELADLVDLMKQERPLYLEESWVQSDAGLRYFVHFLGMDAYSKPWTRALMECGLALAKIVYMHHKAYFRRVRPSTLCPGLAPPWGPPGHPAFPSGHATACHFVALLLLEIGPVAERFGVYDEGVARGRAPKPDDLAKPYGTDLRSPLLWLANRMARNRERLGLHFKSDSSAGRSIAFGLWEAIFRSEGQSDKQIELPALQNVLELARAEWNGAELPLRPPPPPQGSNGSGVAISAGQGTGVGGGTVQPSTLAAKKKTPSAKRALYKGKKPSR